MAKSQENQLQRRKGLGWPRYSDILVQDQLALCFGARDKAVNEGGELMVEQSCSLHGGWEMKRTETNRCQGPPFLFIYLFLLYWGLNPGLCACS
jgi:hypothetical protein